MCNHKRVHRIYCRLNCNKRRGGKRRLPNLSPVTLALSSTINCCWSLDFMCDSLFCGRRFGRLKVVDDFSREKLAIEINVGFSAEQVQPVLGLAWPGAAIRANCGGSTGLSLPPPPSTAGLSLLKRIYTKKTYILTGPTLMSRS